MKSNALFLQIRKHERRLEDTNEALQPTEQTLASVYEGTKTLLERISMMVPHQHDISINLPAVATSNNVASGSAAANSSNENTTPATAVYEAFEVTTRLFTTLEERLDRVQQSLQQNTGVMQVREMNDSFHSRCLLKHPLAEFCSF